MQKQALERPSDILIFSLPELTTKKSCKSISGLVVEYIVAIDVTRVRFPADALSIHSLFGHIHASPFLPPPLLAIPDLLSGGNRTVGINPLGDFSLSPLHSPPSASPSAPRGERGRRRGGAVVSPSNDSPSKRRHTFDALRSIRHHSHQWSSGRIHRCHRCDPGSIPG